MRCNSTEPYSSYVSALSQTRTPHLTLDSLPDLLHEVSLRASSNKMDSNNLAIVITPNLVKSSNPIKDVQICAIPNGPTLHSSARPSHPADSSPSEANTTLGQIIKLCIERYFEVFDELQDPTEARQTLAVEQEITYRPTLQGPISPSLHSHPSRNRDSIIDDDDDDDHEILVMPIGPDSRSHTANGAAWTSAAKLSPTSPRHRTSDSQEFATSRSVYSASPSASASPYGTVGRAKSLISIEKSGNGTGTRRGGSISVGRGTVKGAKGSGSSVEAVGITASGFFAPPTDAPPLPSPPPRHPSIARP